jgi:hypothetical protein
MDCRSLYNFNGNIINYTMAFSVVSDAELIRLRSFGPRCLRASILLGLGFPAVPFQRNSILTNFSSSQYFTLEDCLVLSLRYSPSFSQFVKGNLDQFTFRQEMHVIYNHLYNNMQETCVKSAEN